MQIYAQGLLKYMPSNVEGFGIDVCGPSFIHYYFTKEIVYPKIAARNQGDINHIIDHSYCGLLKAMDPKRTIVTCHDLIPLLYPEAVSRIGKMRYQLNIKFLPGAAKIITGSQFTKQAI